MVELARDHGTSVMLITHNLGLVSRYAQRAVVLQQGRLVETGSVQQILFLAARSLYAPASRSAAAAAVLRPRARAAGEPLISVRGLKVSFGWTASACFRHEADGRSRQWCRSRHCGGRNRRRGRRQRIRQDHARPRHAALDPRRAGGEIRFPRVGDVTSTHDREFRLASQTRFSGPVFLARSTHARRRESWPSRCAMSARLTAAERDRRVAAHARRSRARRPCRALAA